MRHSILAGMARLLGLALLGGVSAASAQEWPMQAIAVKDSGAKVE